MTNKHPSKCGSVHKEIKNLAVPLYCVYKENKTYPTGFKDFTTFGGVIGRKTLTRFPTQLSACAWGLYKDIYPVQILHPKYNSIESLE